MADSGASSETVGGGGRGLGLMLGRFKQKKGDCQGRWQQTDRWKTGFCGRSWELSWANGDRKMWMSVLSGWLRQSQSVRPDRGWSRTSLRLAFAVGKGKCRESIWIWIHCINTWDSERIDKMTLIKGELPRSWDLGLIWKQQENLSQLLLSVHRGS